MILPFRNSFRSSQTGALTYAGANDMEGGAFEWDANGCLCGDSSRGIASIKYNRLNQPVLVKMSSPSPQASRTAFAYDAGGAKIAQIDSVWSPLAGQCAVRRADYWGGCVYEDGALARVLFPGGYATPAAGGAYAYHFFQSDYQGSVRAVLSESGALEEASSYYPYGMLMPGADGELPALQPYKYSGKEYVTIHGLNQYDFGPRSLFSPAGIFTTPDSKAADYPWLSPYIYCAANPINLTDPTSNRIVISKDVSNEELFRILYDLQSLTDDRLVFKTTKAGYMVKIASLGETNKYPVGTNLIRELNSSPTVINISILDDNEDERGNRYRIKSKNVIMDYKHSPSILTEGKDGELLSFKDRPSYIGLSHELIHAYRHLNGKLVEGITSYSYIDNEGNYKTERKVLKEDLETVGLIGKNKYTENKIRREHKLGWRVAY